MFHGVSVVYTDTLNLGTYLLPNKSGANQNFVQVGAQYENCQLYMYEYKK